MLQQVGHADGGVQLSGLVRGLGTLAVVPGDVQKAAVLRSRAGVVLVYKGKKTQGLQRTAVTSEAFSGGRTAGVEPFPKERNVLCDAHKCPYSPVIGTTRQPSRKRTERKRLRETSGQSGAAGYSKSGRFKGLGMGHRQGTTAHSPTPIQGETHETNVTP